MEFDEIRNRLDTLTQKQNEHLKEVVGTKLKSSPNVSNKVTKVISDTSSTTSSRSASPGYNKEKNLNPVVSLILNERPASKSPGSQTKAPVVNLATRPKTPPLNQSRVTGVKVFNEESSEDESLSEEKTPKNEKEILADWNRKPTTDQSASMDIKTTSRIEKFKGDSSSNSTLNNSLKITNKKAKDLNDSYDDDFDSSKSN